jgi:hypothetical protein
MEAVFPTRSASLPGRGKICGISALYAPIAAEIACPRRYYSGKIKSIESLHSTGDWMMGGRCPS